MQKESFLRFSKLAHSSRTLWIFACVAVVWSVCQHVNAQEVTSSESPVPRQWTTKSGQTFEATVANVQKDVVVFNFGADVGEKTLSLGSLVSAEEAELRVRYFVEQDEGQLRESAAFFAGDADATEKTIKELKRLHLSYFESPYCGLWAGAMLASVNKPVEATGLLRQVISRIKRQQKHSPFRHGTTLQSATGNLAVCMIKTHQYASAAGLFAQLLESAHVSSPVIHANAVKLSRWDALDLTPKNRLLRAIPSNSASSTTYLTYDLSADSPSGPAIVKNSLGVQPPGAYLQLRKTATGIAVSPDTVLCSVASLDVSGTDAGNLSVATYRQGRGWESVSVSSVVVSSAELGMLALKTKTARLTPVNAVTGIGNQVATDEDVAVFSFGNQGDQNGPVKLQTVRGAVSLVSDAGVRLTGLGVAPQGPVVNRNAQLIGVLGQPVAGDDARIPLPSKLQSFVSDVIGKTASEKNPPNFSDIQRGCVIVLQWSDDESDDARLVSQLPNWSAQSYVIQDKWCVPCKGTSFVTCGRCTKGWVRKSVRQKVAENIIGESIYANKSIKEKCPSCEGKTGFDCRACNKGRLGY